MYKPPNSNLKVVAPPKLDNIEESQKVDNLDSVRSSTTSQVIAAAGLISGRSALMPDEINFECECDLRY